MEYLNIGEMDIPAFSDAIVPSLPAPNTNGRKYILAALLLIALLVLTAVLYKRLFADEKQYIDEVYQ